jgi:hypothetical protein
LRLNLKSGGMAMENKKQWFFTFKGRKFPLKDSEVNAYLESTFTWHVNFIDGATRNDCYLEIMYKEDIMIFKFSYKEFDESKHTILTAIRSYTHCTLQERNKLNKYILRFKKYVELSKEA